MGKIIHIIKKELIQVFRDRIMLRIIFIMPLLQLLLLGYAITTDIKRIPILMCDYDKSSDSRELIDKFSHSGYFKVNFFEVDRSKISEYLDESRAVIALSIPKNFASDLRRNLNPTLQIIADGQDSNSSLVAMGYANSIIQAYMMEKIAARAKPEFMNIHIVEPEIRIWYNPNLIAKNYMVPGIIALLLTVVTTILTAMGIVREKEIGTLEQLMVSPIKPYQLIIGKTVPFAILGFFEIAFAIILARLWYHISIAGNIGLLAMFAFIFLFTTLGLGIFLSTISKTQQQAMFLAWFIIVFAIIMSGFLYPIDNMPEILQYVTYINPVRYFITVVRELFLKGSGLVYLWTEGLIMMLFSLCIMALSVFRFHKRIQ